MTLADAVSEIMSWQRADHRRAAMIVRDGKVTLQYLDIEAIFDRLDFPESRNRV